MWACSFWSESRVLGLLVRVISTLLLFVQRKSTEAVCSRYRVKAWSFGHWIHVFVELKTGSEDGASRPEETTGGEEWRGMWVGGKLKTKAVRYCAASDRPTVVWS